MNRTYRRRTLMTVVLPTLALGLAACVTAPASPASTPSSVPAQATPTTATTYVGALPGTDAFLALQIGADNRADAYVCDGADLDHWFQGTAAVDGTLALRSAAGAELVGRLDGASLVGTVTVARRAHAVTLAPATGPAGLYEASAAVAGDPYEATWVVLPDGRERGTIRLRRGPVATKTALDKSKLLPESVKEAMRAKRQIRRPPTA